ncbi:hypothetical protein [Ruania halotolerans]|uniref:hypothetical protein n=1 Tax=Ruania halotolerans TaxID=2897773 RepID=UPI001E5D11E8|nr:hypothetical protein [Ruania halotolerans]UFU06768.1 hypothetical protein LQF10_01245 [Ruania halotolerans]
MRRMLGAAAAAAAALLLAGCGPSGDDPSPEPDVTTVEPDEPAEPTDDPAGADPQEHWDERFADLSEEERAAVDDLAERLSVRYYEIYPEPLEEVAWPDGALGCPQPGQSYTQAVVDGYRLILEYRGDIYAYHAGESGELNYCAEPAEPVDDGRESH